MSLDFIRKNNDELEKRAFECEVQVKRLEDSLQKREVELKDKNCQLESTISSL